jgi:hypothetical protein
MSEMDEREFLVRQDGLLIGIAALALLSGMHFSPYFDPAFLLVRFFGPALFISTPLLLYYLTSLLLATTALILGGIPAALFERFTGRTRSDPTSLAVWLVGVGILAAPSMLSMG